MRQIPVDTSTAVAMVAQPPTPKIANRQTGEIATDRETGATLMVVDVMFVMDGNAEILSLAVPETGVPSDLAMGTPVALTGVIARPWERDGRHGIAFRAVAVTPLTAAKA